MKAPARVSLLLAGALVVPALAGFHRVEAHTVVVPDDLPTLQAVMDSLFDSTIDTVLVRAGVVTDSLYAVNLENHWIIGLGDSLTRPTIGKMTLNSNATSTFVNLTFTGQVVTSGEAATRFRDCRFEGPFLSWIDGSPRVLRFERCRIRNRLAAYSDAFLAVDSCWFDGAGRVELGSDGQLDVLHSTFAGASPAVYTYGNDVGGVVRGSTFRVPGTALRLTESTYLVEDNVFEGCGAAIEVVQGTSTIRRNRVRGGGIGIDVSGRAHLSDNVVLDTGGHGIRFVTVEYEWGRIERNVVGRSGGDGIRVERPADRLFAEVVVRSNTSYDNAGSGFAFALDEASADSASHNIGYRNGAHGLVTTGSADPVLHCNDWYANDASAVMGMPASLSDLAVDPEFCDAAQDDVGLFASSPLANAPGCGWIGARSVACDAVAVPLPPGATAITLAPVTPNPSAGAARIRWSSPRAEWVDVTIHDVAGRTIATVVRGVHAAGAHDVTWEGGMIPSGVYFVRLRTAGAAVTRSFLVRR
jgi:hypothetical protein